MDITQALLGCPFCGCEPRQQIVRKHLTGNGIVFLDCCAGMKEGFILDEYKPKYSDSEKAAMRRIAERWNKRTSIAVQRSNK